MSEVIEKFTCPACGKSYFPDKPGLPKQCAKCKTTATGGYKGVPTNPEFRAEYEKRKAGRDSEQGNASGADERTPVTSEQTSENVAA